MAKKVADLLPELKSLIPHHEKIAADVSQKSIGWQIDHSLKAINTISALTIKSNPEEFRSNFNFLRLYIFTMGYIPRGKGKAPKAVTSENISEYELLLQMNEASQQLEKLSTLPPNSFFKHHLFGDLHRKNVERFLYLHTLHHLKIIRDIVNA